MDTGPTPPAFYEDDHDQQLDRGRSPTARRGSFMLRWRMPLTVAILLTFAGVAAIVIWREYHPPLPPLRQKLPETMGAAVSYPDQSKLPEVPKATPNSPPDPAPKADPPTVAPQTQTQSYSGSNFRSDPPPKPRAIFNGAAPATTAAVTAPAIGTGSGPTGDKPAPPDKKDGDVIYAMSKSQGVMAGSLGDNPKVLPRGLIPCLLDWKTDSSIAGEVQCHIPHDIIRNGITLLDAGTVVHASYQADVKTGQYRIRASVDEIDNEKGKCFIELPKADIADTVGVAGMSGSVDNHYIERFLPAVTLSMTQSAMQLAQAALSKGGSTYLSFSNGGGGADSLVQQMLRDQADIPPTITVNTGTPLAVIINRRIDFSRCYSLTLR